jgi:hypothetical protein
LTRDEWVERVAKGFARQLPEQYPKGFALYMAIQVVIEGGYEDYVAGKYPEGVLWASETKED